MKAEEERKAISFSLIEDMRSAGITDMTSSLQSTSNSFFDFSSHSWRNMGLFGRYFGYSRWNLPFLIRRNLTRHFEYLQKDDIFLSRGLERLNLNELKYACEQRGNSSLGQTGEEMQASLRNWCTFNKGITDVNLKVVQAIIREGQNRRTRVVLKASSINEK